jgi:CheY-like chemotaxis protein
MTAREERALGIDVLIADDDAPTRSLLRYLLEQGGFTCAEAEDGPGALDLARATPPRCVLLDLTIPGLDGFTVARRLRSDRQTRSVHIHCLTGRADPEARLLAERAGCDEFLLKPVEPARLLELVHREIEPPENGWVAGLTLTEARDLLDWLKNQGCTNLEASFQAGAGFAVRCVCPPGLRLGRDEAWAVRLFRL